MNNRQSVRSAEVVIAGLPGDGQTRDSRSLPDSSTTKVLDGLDSCRHTPDTCSDCIENKDRVIVGLNWIQSERTSEKQG
jgi:hypothetical protein